MKKILLLSAVLLGTAVASRAGVSVHIGIPLPPLPRVVIGLPVPRVIVQEPCVPAPPICVPPRVVVVPPRVVCAPPPFAVVPRPRVVYALPRTHYYHRCEYRRDYRH